MSMLAEPRKKQKISSNPRGNIWSQDDSKFGQRMLEKMGWSEGKGLGAKLDGKKDHLSVAHKADNKGVGCSASYADNWIANQDDFNSILAGLNENHGQGGDNSPDTVSGLEKKSRSSKCRVHYQKFTKGKDLSLRKREDMDCIFGRRKMKPDKTSPLARTKGVSDDNANQKPVEVDPQSELFTTSTSSLQEYFATKMATIKGEQINQSDSNTGSSASPVESNQSNLNFCSQGQEEVNQSDHKEVNQSDHEEVNQSDVGIKKKRKHKHEKSMDIEIENKEASGDIKKKHKKNKHKRDKKSEKDPIQCSDVDDNNLESLDLEDAVIDSDKFSKKKAKKVKRKKEKDTIPDTEVREEVQSEDVGNDELDQSDQTPKGDEEIVKRKKKKKSSKREKFDYENECTDNISDIIVKDSVKKSESVSTKKAAACNGKVLFEGININKISGYGKKL